MDFMFLTFEVEVVFFLDEKLMGLDVSTIRETYEKALQEQGDQKEATAPNDTAYPRWRWSSKPLY